MKDGTTCLCLHIKNNINNNIRGKNRRSNEKSKSLKNQTKKCESPRKQIKVNITQWAGIHFTVHNVVGALHCRHGTVHGSDMAQCMAARTRIIKQHQRP